MGSCEFKGSLNDIACSRSVKIAWGDPVSKPSKQNPIEFEASDVSQCAKTLAIKPSDLSLIPGTHTIETEN